jgi:hypothetical protein
MIIIAVIIIVFAIIGMFCTGMITGFILYHRNEAFRSFVDGWTDKTTDQ